MRGARIENWELRIENGGGSNQSVLATASLSFWRTLADRNAEQDR